MLRRELERIEGVELGIYIDCRAVVLGGVRTRRVWSGLPVLTDLWALVSAMGNLWSVTGEEIRIAMCHQNVSEGRGLTLLRSDVFPVPLAPITSSLNSPTGFFATLGPMFIRLVVSALRISSLEERKSWLRRRRR